MIGMLTHGNNGRLGNQLFQYASLMGLAKKYNTELRLEAWKYARYFEGEFPRGPIVGVCRDVKEPMFNYVPDWPWIEKGNNANIWGYLQSEKYWKDYEADIRAALKFREDFKQSVRDQFSTRNVFDKETIAISIRRGDYVNNPNYELLPITYYILALFDNFPNWRDCNIVIFSDDIAYCKVHFDCLPNVFFSENNSDIEDICLMSQCTHFIISNSTFSWWGACLGEKEGTKIVRSNYLFAGPLMNANEWKDFYPERWIIFEHKKPNGEFKKIDLKDTCFIIPVSYDHDDRKENLELCVAILQKNFDTNISISEQGESGKFELNNVKYVSEDFDGKFHRTKMLNNMAKASEQKFIFNWDADVFISPLQIYEAVNQLRNGADMVYPYAWAFARMPRNTMFVKVRDYQDIGMVGDTKFNGMNNGDAISLGGAVGFNRDRFLEGGGENENFISYGAEDVERKMRFERLGYRIERTIGATMYHMNHYCGINSGGSHPDIQGNTNEINKVGSMNKEELLNYIKTWNWL